MSVSKKVLLGACGAAALAIGAASTAQAHSVAGVASTATSCDLYARQYAATNAPLVIGWRSAYNFAYNRCLAGGPAFVAAAPAVRAPVASAIAGAVTAPVAAGAALAAGAVQTAGTIAGTALAAPAMAAQALAAPVVAGTAALAPPATTTALVSDAEPVVRTNYVGSFEAADAEAAETTGSSVAALQAPVADIETDLALAAAPAQGTSEWMSYCAAKYRSFDPASGTYLAYSGVRRMCR